MASFLSIHEAHTTCGHLGVDLSALIKRLVAHHICKVMKSSWNTSSKWSPNIRPLVWWLHSLLNPGPKHFGKLTQFHNMPMELNCFVPFSSKEPSKWCVVRTPFWGQYCHLSRTRTASWLLPPPLDPSHTMGPRTNSLTSSHFLRCWNSWRC